MVFFVRITVNQSHLRPICKSTKFNPKIQRTIYLINFQQLRLHVPDFIRTVVYDHLYLEFFAWTQNKCLVCNCYSNANENLSKLHFQCCLFLKIFLRQQEHHIIINDNPQIARDGIIISFIVVKVFALMKRV